MKTIWALVVGVSIAACNGDGIEPAGDTGTSTSDSSTSTSDSSTSDSSTSDSSTSTDTAGDTSGTTAHLTFALTIPPETPLDGSLSLVLGDGANYSLTGDGQGHAGADIDIARGALSWHVTLGQAVELDDAGQAVTHTLTVAGDQSVTAELRRWGPAAGATAPDVAMLVTVPAGTDTASGIWVSGNQPALGDWNGAGIRLVAAQAGRWATTASFPLDTALELKVTRGSWETVEKGASHEEIDNRAWTIAAPYARWEMTVATWRDDQTEPPTGTGDIDVIPDVASAFLTPKRDVLVWLPPGYDTDTTRRYPVLYMHDGQNLFDAATSAFGTEWQVDETAQALITGGEIEPLIIVGVDNTSQRMNEYTESYDAGEGVGGNADNYGRFLVEELKPNIDATYRTKTEAQYTGVAGSSLGGLVSMYFGLTHSETYGRIGVVSPSVWWDDKDIVDRVTALTAKLPLRIWLDIGTAEGSGETVADAQALRDALVGEGWVLGQDLAYTEYAGAVHNEASWAARMDDILRWLYPPP